MIYPLRDCTPFQRGSDEPVNVVTLGAGWSAGSSATLALDLNRSAGEERTVGHVTRRAMARLALATPREW